MATKGTDGEALRREVGRRMKWLDEVNERRGDEGKPAALISDSFPRDIYAAAFGLPATSCARLCDAALALYFTGVDLSPTLPMRAADVFKGCAPRIRSARTQAIRKLGIDPSELEPPADFMLYEGVTAGRLSCKRCGAPLKATKDGRGALMLVCPECGAPHTDAANPSTDGKPR